MSEFAGSAPGMNENILVTAARGRLFVPREQEVNEAEKSKRKILLVCVAVLAVVTAAVALWLGTDTSKIPELDRLTPMVGQSASLAQDGAPLTKYAGVPFTVEYLIWNDTISGFRYTYTGDADAVARGGVEIAKRLGRKFGDPVSADSGALSQLNRKDLARKLTAEDGYSGLWTWDLTEVLHGVNLDVFNDSENWPGRVAGYLLEPAGFYLDLRIEDLPDGSSRIQLVFETTVIH